MDESLINKTIIKARAWHKKWNNSVVLWSGGKDSTALLHLLKFRAGIQIPVVQFREPAFRERYEYSDRLIKDWNLEVHEYLPSKMALADGPDLSGKDKIRFDLLKYYQWGKTCIVLSLGTERPIADEKYVCGVDFLARPTGGINWPWSAAWIGTKNCDTDLIKGHVPLSMDIRYVDGAPISLYLMRDWTDDDIYEYLEMSGVFPDENRYEKSITGWDHKKDKSKNADFIPTCLNCIDRHSADKFAYCPKLKATITNMSDKAPYEDIVFSDLGFKPIWNTTANPAEPVAHTSGAGLCCGVTAPMPQESLPNTSAPTIPCSRPIFADDVSRCAARWGEESPAQYTNPAQTHAEHFSKEVPFA